MVLSNAERQRRFRERLKAQAAGLDVVDRVRVAMAQAMDVVWEMGHRDDFGDFDGIENREDWLAMVRDPKFRKRNGGGDYLRMTLSAYLDDANESEQAILHRAIELIDAVTLR